jgi:DNA topoisomerase I
LSKTSITLPSDCGSSHAANSFYDASSMSQTAVSVDFPPEELARIAKLRYVIDEEPGIIRQLNGKGFQYHNGHGRRLRDKRQLTRIDSLAIPPAWTDVWICRYSNGHLQATGRDARGRKQYLYHEHWRGISNAAKFWRLKGCPRFLPTLRRRVAIDLRGRELSLKRVVAGMVALLDLTSIRIGSEEYVRENNSFGLATLRTRHVQVKGSTALLRFRAKAGLRREAEVTDKRLVRLLKQLKKLPGAHVFQYRDNDGEVHAADANAVNTYLAERTGHYFTAKDFRTWKASALAAGIFYDQRSVEELTSRKKIVKKAIVVVSEALGNTPAICRKYYIHSGLLDAYLDGHAPQIFDGFRPSRKRSLSRDEQLLARFLRRS